jgi:hypothetical protein
VSQINDLLGASCQIYSHVKTNLNETIFRTTSSFDSPQKRWQRNTASWRESS